VVEPLNRRRANPRLRQLNLIFAKLSKNWGEKAPQVRFSFAL